MSSEAEVRRRWREWKWVCSPCADKLGIEGWRCVHQGPYADKCYVCGGEARYVVDPATCAEPMYHEGWHRGFGKKGRHTWRETSRSTEEKVRVEKPRRGT